jgi:hypothetical protein
MIVVCWILVLWHDPTFSFWDVFLRCVLRRFCHVDDVVLVLVLARSSFSSFMASPIPSFIADSANCWAAVAVALIAVFLSQSSSPSSHPEIIRTHSLQVVSITFPLALPFCQSINGLAASKNG